MEARESGARSRARDVGCGVHRVRLEVVRQQAGCSALVAGAAGRIVDEQGSCKTSLVALLVNRGRV